MTDPFSGGLPTLSSERVRLRHPRASDLPAFLEVFGDREALAYWSHGPLEGEEAARKYLENIEAGLARRELFQWAVADLESDAMLGTVTLAGYDEKNRRADVGFILGRRHWKKGLAREAVIRGLRFGFEELDLHRVEADVDPDNAASLRLLEGIGFRREGYLRERWLTFGNWRDTVLLGLLETDFTGD